MREIKLRAWDSARKEMIATGFHVIGEVTMFSVIEQWLSEHSIEGKGILERLVDVVLSEFTGMQDSEGNDIYEGDVLIREFDQRKYKVVFICGCFCLKTEKGYDVPFAISVNDFSVLKIIGNIYENSNLIS